MSSAPDRETKMREALEKLCELHGQILAKSVQVFTRGAKAHQEYEALIRQKEELLAEIVNL